VVDLVDLLLGRLVVIDLLLGFGGIDRCLGLSGERCLLGGEDGVERRGELRR
jgi:hypothetical protein